MIVADGVLQSLPFAALPSPTRAVDALGSTHEIVVLPSASVGSALRTRTASRAAPPPAIAVFADPVFSTADTRVTCRRSRGRCRDRPSAPPLFPARGRPHRPAGASPHDGLVRFHRQPIDRAPA